MQLPLEPHKALYYFNAYKALMCETGGKFLKRTNVRTLRQCKVMYLFCLEVLLWSMKHWVKLNVCLPLSDGVWALFLKLDPQQHGLEVFLCMGQTPVLLNRLPNTDVTHDMLYVYRSIHLIHIYHLCDHLLVYSTIQMILRFLYIHSRQEVRTQTNTPFPLFKNLT